MHLRTRQIISVMKKRSKIFPVVGLLGPRQVGKSTFLSGEWKELTKSQYITLDNSTIMREAKRSPEALILSQSNNLDKKLIIDEVQKVPQLFDSIKSLVDENRKVGTFTVSGSVEFSNRSGVRESLAGRIGLCRLYPLTLAELNNRKFIAPWCDGLKRKNLTTNYHEIELWLNRGGMPIFCKLSNINERESQIESWLEAICYKDLNLLKLGKLEGDVAINILKYLANNPDVNNTKLASEVSISRSAVEKYLSAFEALFIIYKLNNIKNRSSRSSYLLFDTALINYLCPKENLLNKYLTLRTLVVNEILAQFAYKGEERPAIFIYRGTGGAKVDLVLKSNKTFLGIEIFQKSDIKPYDIRGLESFLSNNKGSKGIILAPITERYQINDRITAIPWFEIG